MDSKYEQLAETGVSAQKLADIFLEDYFEGNTPVFPINPFEIIRHHGILFTLKPFKKYEGVYIPPNDEKDIPVIAINAKRPITRQRYTAAHELCHFLKDTNNSFVCNSSPRSIVEKYAEAFASELLMPQEYLRAEAQKYVVNGYVSLDSVLRIADYFGVSFESCLYKLAYKLKLIDGDISPEELKKKAKKYKPATKRKEKGYSEVLLYAQLFDCMDGSFSLIDNNYAHLKFKNEYIYNDSRMEGIDIEQEQVSDIVSDLRKNKNESKFCKENNNNIIEVAGLTLAYDFAFDNFTSDLDINTIKTINRLLFSTAPYPEYGGKYREMNTLVLGAKFETVDCWEIYEHMFDLDEKVKQLIKKTDKISISDYLLEVLKIHHQLTIIHPFQDGNGRTSRVFLNMLLLRKGISPTFLTMKEKDSYKNALASADSSGKIDELLEVYYKSIIRSNYELSPKAIP